MHLEDDVTFAPRQVPGGRRIAGGIAALVALATLVVLPPWLLLVSIGNPWPDSGISFDRQLGTDAIFGLLALVVWLGWAQFVLCVLAEIVAALGARRAQRVPVAFGLQQDLARKLVVAAMAMLATGSVVGTASAAVASPAEAGTTQSVSGPAIDDAEGTANSAPAASALIVSDEGQGRSDHAETRTRSVTVERMDSLWSIAERELGEGERWTEIAALNEGRAMPDGRTFAADAVLRPGWDLLVPDDSVDASRDVVGAAEPAASGQPEQHVVEPGETLWQIADDATGDPTRYVELFHASNDIKQPGGARLADPHHIEPGWTIRLPSATPALAPETDSSASEVQPALPGTSDVAQDAPSAVPDPPPRSTAPSGSDTAERTGPVDRIELADADEDGVGATAEVTALRALLATATLLAAGAFAALMTNRARQLRHRRPGRMIAPTPVDVGIVEHAVTDVGAQAGETAVWIDRVLRELGAICRRQDVPPPNVASARLTDGTLELHLLEAATAELPPGWAVDEVGMRWTVARTHQVADDAEEAPAPYPALISVGRDRAGDTWLLDIEVGGRVDVIASLGREPIAPATHRRRARAVDGVLRFMVAELALNRWGVGTRIHVADDLGRSIVRVNPDRVRVTDPAAALASLDRARAHESDSLATMELDPLRLRLASPDSAEPVVVVLSDHDSPGVDGAVRTRGVVLSGDRPQTNDAAVAMRTSLVLADDGSGRIERVGAEAVELIEVFTLDEGQAADLGRLLDATTSTRDVAMPPRAATSPLAAAMRVDGSALNAELRRTPDPAPSAEPVEPSDAEVARDEGSLLPEPPAVYVERAATTAEDVELLGATVDAEEAARVLALDPTLDDDVAAWFDTDSPRPKIQVFGPVVVRAKGGAVRNIGGTTEFVIYLACHEAGVTAGRAAVDLEWSEATVHNRARDARTYLGPHPQDGDWLPDATRTPAARERGVPMYQLDPGVLFSADLFRRLRLRAQARGATGIEDLVTALRLVEGRPFDALRRRGYGWLSTGDPIQHHLTAAVVDVAHIVATLSIAEGDTERSQWACEVAIGADEHSHVPRTDLVAVHALINPEWGATASDDSDEDPVRNRVTSGESSSTCSPIASAPKRRQSVKRSVSITT